MLDNTGSRQGKTTLFSDTVRPFLEHGWPQVAMLPAWPRQKKPGRYLGFSNWCGLEGNGLLTLGLAACTKPTTWEQVQAWPTDGLCMLGAAAPGLDIDSEVFEVHAALRMLLPDQVYERGRYNSLRTLLPFRSSAPIKGWKPLRFTMPGVEGVQAIEFNGAGRQWIAAGTHRGGGLYMWADTVGPMGGPPSYLDLQPLKQDEADALRERIAVALESIGAVFVDGSRHAGPAAGQQAHDTIETDTLEPLISLELLERVFQEIPDTPETVGGWDESIPLLASIRYCLGHLGAICPDIVEDWTIEYPGSDIWWIEARWASLDGGVSVRQGTFLQWVAKHGSAELSAECETAINGALAQRVFEETEELDDDEYGPRQADGAGAGGGVGGEGGNAPAGGRVGKLKYAPNMTDAAAVMIRAPILRGVFGYSELQDSGMLCAPLPNIQGKVTKKELKAFKGMTVWKDENTRKLLAWAQEHGGMPKLSKEVCYEAARYLGETTNRIDPVADYLRGLKWDGVKRIDMWLKTYCHAVDDDDYLKLIGPKVLISAVARAVQPGCQVDTMMVMHGRQGVGKSSLFRLLMPDERWFSGTPPHDLANKEAKGHLRGKWIIEMAELASFKGTKNVEALKNYLSTTADAYRPVWGKDDVPFPRRVIFVGSTNAKQFLSDDTGNRRFWPVEFNGADVDRDAIVRDRDQLWAEAVAAFDAGQRWHLEGAAENDMAGSRQAERMEVHPWLELLADYLESRVEVTVNELMQHAIPMEAAKREPRLANTIGGLMGRLGWVTKQVRRPGSKNPVRVWVPVTAEP